MVAWIYITEAMWYEDLRAHEGEVTGINRQLFSQINISKFIFIKISDVYLMYFYQRFFYSLYFLEKTEF